MSVSVEVKTQTGEKKITASSGDRVRRARILAGIATRREFEKRHKISSNTLQGWEQGKNPLTEKGAHRMVEALRGEGLLCTVDWLMYGTGLPPRSFETVQAGLKKTYSRENILSELNLREEEAIYKESQTFKDQNLNSIILTIVDNAMEPFYSIGDYVGGVMVYGDEIKKLAGTTCIIELENNLILPRYLHLGPRDGIYIASCTNPKTKTAPLNFYNVELVGAAPILWHRRKLSSLKNTEE